MTTIDWFIALGEIRTKYYITTNSEFKIESSKIGLNVNENLISLKVEKQPQMMNYWYKLHFIKGEMKATKNLSNGWFLIKRYIHVVRWKCSFEKNTFRTLLFKLNVFFHISSTKYQCPTKRYIWYKIRLRYYEISTRRLIVVTDFWKNFVYKNHFKNNVIYCMQH